MKFAVRLSVCFVLLSLACGVHAQDADKPTDAEGCKDSPLVTRMPGSTINSCENKEYEQAEMPVSKDSSGGAVSKTFEGEYHTWNYGNREGLGDIQVFRNFDTALRRAGFTIDYEESPHVITAHKGDTWCLMGLNDAYYDQTIVTVKAMTQEVTADASSISSELNTSGHIAIYGIHFDTGKAVILPDSEGILGEIAKMLDADPDVKLQVEGHTDNVGAAAANQTLSERRAQAVVAWLVAHGVSASRLSAKGLGQTKPVADNSTDEGRAKNRRVELVKQ